VSDDPDVVTFGCSLQVTTPAAGVEAVDSSRGHVGTLQSGGNGGSSIGPAGVAKARLILAREPCKGNMITPFVLWVRPPVDALGGCFYGMNLSTQLVV
jgi:hypothetical protein